VLRFAEAAASPTVFILPGVVNPGQSREEAAPSRAESLRALLELPRAPASALRGAACPFLGREPDLARRLIDETGVRLALDYAHLTCLGFRQEEIDPLAPPSPPMSICGRPGPGALQAKFAQGTINFPALLGTLREAGLQGALALEAVHQDYMGTLHDDVLTETVLMRDAVRGWSGG
jgi:sugar phosphate isomerase/epimerase